MKRRRLAKKITKREQRNYLPINRCADLQTEPILSQEPSEQGNCAVSSSTSSFPSIDTNVDTSGATEGNFQKTDVRSKLDALRKIENDPLFIRMKEYFMLKSRIGKILKI
jgi:hypothetical protein